MSSYYRYSDAEDQPHHIPRSHRPARRSNLRPPMSYTTPGGTDAERIGAYVAQHLVPTMLAHQDQPVQLVLNFGGPLHLAPGANMAAAGSQGFTTRSRSTSGNQGLGMDTGMGVSSGHSDLGPGSRPRRTVGYCWGCCRRQLVGPAGNCRNCDDLLLNGDRRGLGGAGGGGSGDGIRYVSARDPWPRRELRGVGLGAHQYQGYWGDSEAGGYSSGRW